MPKRRGKKPDVAGKREEVHYHCLKCEYKDEIQKVFNHMRSKHGVMERALLCTDTTCFQTKLSEKLPVEHSSATVEAGTPNPEKCETVAEECRWNGMQEGAIEKDIGACIFDAVKNVITNPYNETLERRLEVVKTLLNNELSPKARNEDGESLLLYSLQCTRCASSDAHQDAGFSLKLPVLWRLLLDEGANPRIKDNMDRSFLHILLSNLKNGVFQPNLCLNLVSSSLSILQMKGFEINTRDTEGNTPLHLWASYAKEPVDAVLSVGEVIISHGGAVNARNDKDETPLHLSQSWQLADFLIEKHAHSNAPDLDGNTPLHKFIERGLVDDKVSKSRWERCLAVGIDPFCKNKSDEKCSFEILLDKKLCRTALNLLKAVVENEQNRELAKSASRFRDGKGDSLLHILCVTENRDALSICEYLLQNGWGVNLRNMRSETALHMVCKKVASGSRFSPEIIRDTITLLRRYHADASLPDGDGNTCDAMLSSFKKLRGFLHVGVEKDVIPAAAPLLQFPFLSWNDFVLLIFRVQFLLNVGVQKEFEEERRRLERKLTDVEASLERDYRLERTRQRQDLDWKDDIKEIYDAVTKHYPNRWYDTTSAVELVRFIRNVYVHRWDNYTERIRNQLANFSFIRKFPFLLGILYKAVNASESWKTRSQLKIFFEQ